MPWNKLKNIFIHAQKFIHSHQVFCRHQFLKLLKRKRQLKLI
jgi:hypothetical protein